MHNLAREVGEGVTQAEFVEAPRSWVVVDRAVAGRVVLVLVGCVIAERDSGVACVSTFSDALLVLTAVVVRVVDVVRR